MQSDRVLFSWIGHNDLLSAAEQCPRAEQKRVIEALRINPPLPLKRQDGPVRTLLSHSSFSEVHLLSSYPKWLNQLYMEWLGFDATVHQVRLTDPTDFGQIHDALEPVLRSVGKSRELSYSFLLTPGTPSMAATWVLLGKSPRFNAEFWQTYQDTASVARIPFDLVSAYASDIAQFPDARLQNLVTGPPSSFRGFEDIVGDSREISLAANRAAKAAIRDVPVLILGAAGTGKDLFARAIHNASRRGRKKFIPVNCAAIPESLLESTLFGYAPGAFSNSLKSGQAGIFEQADGGTVFLDEIGEASPGLQAALLRVLQSSPQGRICHREFARVGDPGKLYHSDVRIVCATNRDLQAEVEAGKFREDLFYRISAIKIKLPPLKSRKSDLPALADTLLKQINQDFRDTEPDYLEKTLSESARQFISSYDWPGNVRQLRNTLVEAAVMVSSASISAADLQAAIADIPQSKASLQRQTLGNGFSIRKFVDDTQRQLIEQALEESEGNKTRAAQLLGLPSYQSLDAMIRRLRIRPRIAIRKRRR